MQTCIVHLIRNSLAFVAWKDRKAIYRAENADMALVRLVEFEAEWGKRYPAIGAAWRNVWEYVVPFFAAHSAPRCEPANSQDLRPSAKPRRARSAALLVRQIRPSSNSEPG